MNQKKKWILSVTVLIFLDLVAISITSTTDKELLSVSDIYASKILGDDVIVKGEVTAILPEYVSKKGFKYQQFILSDENERIKVFCSEKYGKKNIAVGDTVIFEGKFQKYYGEFEIYGFCSEIKVL